MYYNDGNPHGGQGQVGGQYGGGMINKGQGGGYAPMGGTKNYFPWSHSYPMLWWNRFGHSHKGLEHHIIKECSSLLYDAKKKLKENPESNEWIQDLYSAYQRLEHFLSTVDKEGMLQK